MAKRKLAIVSILLQNSHSGYKLCKMQQRCSCIGMKERRWLLRCSDTRARQAVKRRVGASAVTDENVCIDIICKYFSSEAWSVVHAVVNTVKHDPLLYCGSCTQAINDDEQSVACELPAVESLCNRFRFCLKVQGVYFIIIQILLIFCQNTRLI